MLSAYNSSYSVEQKCYQPTIVMLSANKSIVTAIFSYFDRVTLATFLWSLIDTDPGV